MDSLKPFANPKDTDQHFFLLLFCNFPQDLWIVAKKQKTLMVTGQCFNNFIGVTSKVRTLVLKGPTPLEAILVIFGRRALIFFFV